MDEENVTVISEDDRVEIEKRIRVELEAEYNTRLDSAVNKISQQMQQENKRVVEEALERYRKEMAPPSTEDVQKLLSQEYVEFKMEVKVPGVSGPDGHPAYTKEFVIQELPQKIERKIFKRVKDILLPFSEDLGALSIHLLEGDVSSKIIKIMNTFEPAFETMVAVSCICLNPYEEDKEVTEEWVRDHLSSTRILRVVMAQFEVNHMRDFFSLLFQGSTLLK